MILTLDLGTSTTKAVVWDGDGPRATGRGPLETAHPSGDRAEQDPATWWASVVAACAEARAASPESFTAVTAVGFSAARQTIVGVSATGQTFGPALVWSDGRATAEAEAMAERLGGTEAVRARTGGVLDGAAVAAKVAWLSTHDPDRWAACRWLLTPRDLVLWRMTGEVATDRTMVSAAGLCDAGGEPVAELVAALGDRLPPVLDPDTVTGPLAPGPAAELGLRPGLPVVIGAGDRACEVLGTAASPDRPMVSWGTTANVSLPVDHFPVPVPDGMTVTGAASGGWLLEAGLSAAGSLLGWLSALTAMDTGALMTRAAACPAGAHGVVALPWFGGARAPWWRQEAGGAFVGLSFDHDAGDLARAAVESVAWDVRRCLGATGVPPTSLSLTGADEATAPWAEVLTAVTGVPAVRRRSGQAASAGAALLAARAVGAGFLLDDLDPVVETVTPDQSAQARYAEMRRRADAVADAVVALPGPAPGRGEGAVKEVRLAYGRRGLVARVPDAAAVITPTDLPGLPDEAAAVRRALREPTAGPPLADLVGPRLRVAVVFPDLTRPMPNRTVLSPLLDELERLGAGPDRVELLCATGTHRQATAAEMAELVGGEIVARYRIHDHRADDGAHVEVGVVDGTPVLIDPRYLDADVRILTGFVEPHFFAGFSGGPKGVCPGLAATETILEAHSPTRIAHRRATWLVTAGNPVHDFVRAAAALAPPTLSVDVAINNRRRLTAVFAGPLPDGHLAARAFVEDTAVQRVDGLFDVVVTTNAGYPLDRNLYQAVKGMAAAERVVAPGGTIVAAAACADGLPAGGPFARVLAEARRPEDLVSEAGPSAPDRWQAQVLGRVLRRASVWLHTDGLSDEEVRAAHLRPVGDVSAAVARALHTAGPGARLCVLPQGPLTVATAL